MKKTKRKKTKIINFKLDTMGCDIHFFVERFSTDPEPGLLDKRGRRDKKINEIVGDIKVDNSLVPKWISVGEWECDFDDDYTYWSVNNGIDIDRDYWLFSKLADVRNYDSVIKPICEPKGVPSDLSEPHMHVYSKQWNGDAHSASYFTLKELIDSNTDWKEVCPDFESVVMAQMAKIDPDPEKVRCFFFFDN